MGLEAFGTGGIHKRRVTKKEGFSTGGIQERRYEYSGLQRDTGKEGFGNGGMQDWSDTVQERRV